jgi:citrate lyase beta subunit
VRHFDFLSAPESAELFAVAPETFHRDSPAGLLGIALGATLYSPGTRPALAEDARRAAQIGATSQVWDLEDGIAHADVGSALGNVVDQLQVVHESCDQEWPLLFVRVRNHQQILDIVGGAGKAAAALTGFILPKMSPDQAGKLFLQAIVDVSEETGRRIYAVPVLEHEDLAWQETRTAHLSGLRNLFDRHRDHILSLRVGGTDLCGLFGLRRDSDTTIWDVAVVRDALGDVLNVFARRGDYALSAPVWEHFSGTDRLFRPQLRFTPFERGNRMRLRQQLLREDVDELIREVLLDRANGFHGKTVIHPTHVAIVNTLHAVHPEEYDDATTVLAQRDRGGAVASAAGNKMNELGPHGLWAEQVVARARVYGVLSRPDSVIELLQRGRTLADSVYPARPGIGGSAVVGR